MVLCQLVCCAFPSPALRAALSSWRRWKEGESSAVWSRRSWAEPEAPRQWVPSGPGQGGFALPQDKLLSIMGVPTLQRLCRPPRTIGS